MGKIIDRTGEIFNNLQITQELGDKKVLAKCLLCQSIKEYRKSDIVGGKSKSCGCAPRTRLKDRTGEKHNNMIILKELGNHKVIARCILCNSEKTYFKNSILSGRTKSCGCTPKPNFIDRTGQIFNNLQIVKELGNRKVIARCLLCETEKQFEKYTIVSGKIKSCGCAMGGLIDKTGHIYGNLKITEELGIGEVMAECLLCGSLKQYRKSQITLGKSTHCGCGRGLNRIKDLTGQVFKDIEIIEELRENKVKGRCLKCKHLDIYKKNSLIKEEIECKNCGITRNYKDKIIGAIVILNFVYIGRDSNKYYNCRCSKCGEELVMNREEIINYTCTKEG